MKEIFWNCGLIHLWLLNARKQAEKQLYFTCPYTCPPARLEEVKQGKSR